MIEIIINCSLYIKKGNTEIAYTFQKTYFGYWRYAGCGEVDSFREIFQRRFGRSPI